MLMRTRWSVKRLKFLEVSATRATTKKVLYMTEILEQWPEYTE